MSNENKIAIVGFSGEFPNCKDVYHLWENTLNGIDCIKKFTRDEVDSYHNDLGYVDSRNYRFVGGYPFGYSSFDAAFFGISPKEAMFMDPQQRKFLECAYKALEHAGYNPLEMPNSVGVFASEGVNSYLLNNIIDSGNWAEDDKEMAIYGAGYDYLSTRVSYLLNLKGPSFTIQSGCSGSLVAVHMAVQSLLSYECDTALAGGVSISTPVEVGYMYQENGILSESGVCRPFDKNADGTIFTNGYGAVVLKRLEDAIADNDTIFATIIGSSANNDGNDKISYSAPSVSGQKEVIMAACSVAEINPDDIGYIESHGTGTKLGDPIEFAALSQAFSKATKNNSCVLGSVKSYLGHMNSAAGIVGLLSTIGYIINKKLPATLHFEEANPEMDINNSHFTILKKTKDWECNDLRRAGVSSFGVGGTNVHVILEEYKDNNLPVQNTSHEIVFMLSAKSEASLKNQIQKWIEFLESNRLINMKDLFFTLAVGRPTFEYKVAFVASSVSEILEELKNQKIIKSLVSSKIVVSNELNMQQLCDAFLDGDQINWEGFFEDCKHIPLPTYFFENVKYWLEIGYRGGSSFVNRKNPNIDEWFYTPTYVEEDIEEHSLDINKRWLILEESGNEISKQIKKIYPNINLTTVNLHDIKSKEEYFDIFNKLKKSEEIPEIIVHCYSLNNFSEVGDNRILDNGLFSLLYTVQALSSVDRNGKYTIAVLTNQLGCILDEKISPLKSTLFGISKTINKEYPYFCKVLDIGSELTKGIIEAIEFSQEEFSIYRKDRKFVEKYRRIRIPSDERVQLENGTYVITGGLGYFGLDIAQLISEKVPKAQIVLVSRSLFPSREEWSGIIEREGKNHGLSKKILRLQQIESNGAKIHIESANVKNINEIEKIYETYGSDLVGIVHAAGVVESSIIDRKTTESFNTLFDAKVWGSINIVNGAQKYNPKFILLCSSMNSMIGGLGQADNTASTSFVDYFSKYCHANGIKNVFAINWGAVNQTHRREFESLVEFRDLSEEHFKNRMRDDERFIVFEKLLKQGVKWHRVIISTIELNAVLENWNKVSTVTSLIKDRKITYKKRTDIHKIGASEIILPRNQYEEFLCVCFSDILGIDKISTNDNFFELGGHSLSAIRLNEKIKSKFGLSLHAMSIYEYPQLSSLAAFIQEWVESKYQR